MIDINELMDKYQDKICKLCEDSILECQNMTSTFMCEGCRCDEACELYIEYNPYLNIDNYEIF